MENQKKRIGLVGFGYWGPNLLRNLVANPDCEVIGVVDTTESAREKVHSIYPHIPTSDNLTEFLRAKKPDAMFIATPPSTHSKLAIQCVNAGAHVLVEKPLALSSEDCNKILSTAKKQNKFVMVDHTFVYNPAVEYLQRQTQEGVFGSLLYYDSVRVNLGGFQPQTNVLWDLAPHDLSIIDFLTNGRIPKHVTAVGVKHFDASVENLCYLNLTYSDKFIAHIHLNWSAPVKLRTVMVGGDKKMAIYDDNLPTEKVKIYDKSVSLKNRSKKDFRVSYRVGDMLAPAIPQKEALAGMVNEFISAISENREPLTNGEAGLRMVQILEAASESMKHNGKPVEITTLMKSTKIEKTAA